MNDAERERDAADRLAKALRAGGYLPLADRAEALEFSDFSSPHAMPKMKLGELLLGQEHAPAAAHAIRRRVIEGEFDG